MNAQAISRHRGATQSATKRRNVLFARWSRKSVRKPARGDLERLANVSPSPPTYQLVYDGATGPPGARKSAVFAERGRSSRSRLLLFAVQ
jgi:hypothetical protein